jgi:hypothetical protein
MCCSGMPDLEPNLAEFQTYDNDARSHASLEGHTPLTFAGEHTVGPGYPERCAPGSLTAGTSSSSQSPHDNEFDTDRTPRLPSE